MDKFREQFTHLITQLNGFGLAYLRVIDGRIAGDDDIASPDMMDSLDFVYDSYIAGPVLLAGGFSRESAMKLVDETKALRDVAVVFGRHFTSTPDLMYRLEGP